MVWVDFTIKMEGCTRGSGSMDTSRAMGNCIISPRGLPMMDNGEKISSVEKVYCTTNFLRV